LIKLKKREAKLMKKLYKKYKISMPLKIYFQSTKEQNKRMIYLKKTKMISRVCLLNLKNLTKEDRKLILQLLTILDNFLNF
jgi:hypothetical protein